MTIILVAPALLGVAVAVCGATMGHRKLSPAIAARLITVIALSSLASMVTAVGLLASGLAARVGLGSWFAWCSNVVGTHDAIPTPVTEVAAVLLAAMAFGAFRYSRRWRKALARWGQADELEVIDVDEPFAYAVPGSPGHVVVSSGLLRELEPSERRALLEHERAHLQLRHSRYLKLVGMSAAALPLLRPLVDEIRFVTERWADEIAAAAVGDRNVVASAIARTALASTPANAMGLGDSDVAARVQALVVSTSGRPGWRPTTALGVSAAACTGSMMIQAHHLVTYGLHVCGIG
ncbi:MAG TPA: M56 family metallopeptidase [Mycobacterium sp.]|nr:M56 family metallopeptidase [Mycobacterium sp.]